MTGIENPVLGQDKWFKTRAPRTRTKTRTEMGSKIGPENDSLVQGQDSQDPDRHQDGDRIRTRTRKCWSGSKPGLQGPGQAPGWRQDQNKDQKMLVWFKARTPRTRTGTRKETGSEQGPENVGLVQSQDSKDPDRHQNRDRIRTRTRK